MMQFLSKYFEYLLLLVPMNSLSGKLVSVVTYYVLSRMRTLLIFHQNILMVD